MHTIVSSATKTVRVGEDQLACQGKAPVNSVTAEDERLEAILPLVKKYGAAVIGLPDARAPQVVRAVKAADLVLGRDEWGANWIAGHRAQQAAQLAALQAAEEARAQGQGVT